MSADDSIANQLEQIAILANRITKIDDDLIEMRANPEDYADDDVADAIRERERCELTQVKVVANLAIERENMEQQDRAMALELNRAPTWYHPPYSSSSPGSGARAEWKWTPPVSYSGSLGKPLFSPAGISCRHCRVPEAAQALYIHNMCGAAYCHGCLIAYHPKCRDMRLMGAPASASCPKCSGDCKGPDACECTQPTADSGV